MNPLRIHDYLVRSRQPVLDAVRLLTPAQYGRRFDFGMGSIARTLTHVMVSEWYSIERLEGRAVPPYEQWPIQDEAPPPFEIVDATWRAQGPGVRASIAAQCDWNRPISWLGFPDEAGRHPIVSTNAGDLVTQLALHEVHHRAQVMAMLRLMGDGVAPVEDIDFNLMMFERRFPPDDEAAIASHLAAAADLDAALATVIAHFGADSGTVHLLGDDGQLHLAAASAGIPEPVRRIVAVVPIGKGMAGLAAERDAPVTACNIQTDTSGDVRPGAKATGMEGAIVVPMRRDGRIVGTLGIANRGERTFTDSEQAALIAAGEAIAVAHVR